MSRRPVKPQWRDKDARANGAAKRRARGWSTRQIATDMFVSHQTVMRDLKRWDEKHANVVQIAGPNSTRQVRNGPVEMDQQCERDVTVLNDRRRTS